MKKLFTLIILIASIGFFGCSEEENPDQQIIGTWELEESIASWPTETPSGNNEAYFVSYRFNQDGTFLKTTIFNDPEQKSTGTYSISTDEEHTIVYLIFETGLDRIQSCTSSSKTEDFILTSKTRLEGTWSYCDGALLIFNKI